jgi:hypothetical protein
MDSKAYVYVLSTKFKIDAPAILFMHRKFLIFWEGQYQNRILLIKKLRTD